MIAFSVDIGISMDIDITAVTVLTAADACCVLAAGSRYFRTGNSDSTAAYIVTAADTGSIFSALGSYL